MTTVYNAGCDVNATSTGSNGGLTNVILSRVCAGFSGRVSEIRVKVSTAGTVKVALYADSSGSPGSLLAAVNSAASVSAGWNTITLASPVDVSSGSYYWIGFFGSVTSGMFYYRSATGYTNKYKSATYSSWSFPDPAGSGWTTQSDYEYFNAIWGFKVVSPTGIASAEVFGTPKVTLKIAPSGIASLEAFGSPTVTKGVSGQEIIPTGIPSAEAFGTPSLRYPQFISPTGIPSAQAFGTLTIGKIVIYPVGIGSTETFGTPAVVFTYLKSLRYQIEVHASNGDLVAILENAYNISLTETLNAPKQLTFYSPADEAKLSDITRAAELWVRDMKNNIVLAKTRLERRDDDRNSN